MTTPTRKRGNSFSFIMFKTSKSRYIQPLFLYNNRTAAHPSNIFFINFTIYNVMLN